MPTVDTASVGSIDVQPPVGGKATPDYTAYVETTDAPSSTATSYSFMVGDTFSGTIETGSDTDWVAIDLTAGTTYTFLEQGAPSGSGTLSDPYMYLYNSTGSQVAYNDDYSNLESQITYTPATSGTYYLAAGSFGSYTGSYQLVAASAIVPTPLTETTDAPSNSSTPYTLTIGDSFTGTISTGSDTDWVAVELTAGSTYQFNENGVRSGSGTLSDPYMYLYDSAGSLLRYNDDANGLESQIVFTAATTGTYYVAAGSFSTGTGTYTLTASEVVPPPTGTVDDFVDQLVNGYWDSTGRTWRAFDVSTGGDITVNITGLTSSGQQLARWALEAWTSVTGISFTETSGSANITFDDASSGAYSSSSVSGNTILSSSVNVGTSWISTYGTSIDSYSLQTYIHEIGHALGLGHAGDYNGSASYGTDNLYTNDSWQMSIMSYFSQTENTSITASFAWITDPMIADIAAVQQLYGTPNSAETYSGNTTWGAHSNVGGYLGQLFRQVFHEDTADSAIYSGGPIAFTIWDSAGNDTLDLSPATSNQRIDLAPGAISDILGNTGNMTIAQGVTLENAIGGSGADTISGNTADNVLSGGSGNDSLSGDSGNDQLYGGAGADTLNGGAGNDIARYDHSTAGVTVYLDGTPGVGGEAAGDVLTGIETVIGSAYDDSLTGDANRNSLWGRNGNDSLDGGAGDDTLLGGAGADTLVGGTGTDQAYYGGSSAAVTVNLATGTGTGGEAEGDVLSGIEGVFGSSHDDSLTGDSGDNILYGQTGDDTLTGGGGDDLLIGGAGNDSFVYGSGWGNDTLGDYDGSGDQLDLSATGLSFIDLTITQQGTDVLVSDGSGDSLLLKNTSAGMIDAAALNIAVGVSTISGTAASEVLHGTQNGEEIDGGDGHDTLMGGAGADTLVGGAGTDQAYYASSSAAVAVNLATGINTGGDAEGDVLMGIENVYGSVYDDSLTGDAGRNALYGQTGDDTLTGGGGNDILIGGSGSDSFIFGTGWGNDTIIDYDGNADHLDLSGTGLTFADLTVTQQGSNTLISDGSNSILLRNTNAGSIDATALNIAAGGVSTISGTAASEVLHGTQNGEEIDGGDGHDTLMGGEGADTLVGGNGVDQAYYASSSAAVTVNLTTGVNTGGDAEGDVLMGIENVYGSVYDDSLTGDAGRNALYGQTGNDTLTGGGGNDILFGGSGSDSFVYGSGWGNDTIIDYDGNADHLDMSGTGLTFADLTVTQQGSDALVSDGSNSILLRNTNAGSIDATALNIAAGGVSTISGTAASEVLHGTQNGEEIDGGDGHDTLMGGEGADTLVGGNGVDQAYYASSSAAVTVNLTTGVNTGGDAEGDVLMGIENVYGSVYDDSLTGDAGRNALYGQTGNDTLTGGGGNDILFGGSGSDSFVYGSGWGNDTIRDFQDGSDMLDFTSSGLVYADLTITQQGSDVLIDDGSGDTILLIGASLPNIDASDFVF